MSVLAAACSAALLACAPAQTPLAHGTLLAVRPQVGGLLRVVDLRTGKTRWHLPPGPLGGHLVVHRDGSLLTWFDADTGARIGDAVLQTHGSFTLVGVSQNGRVAVLARTELRSTTFALVSTAGEREVSRPGHWRFEALNGVRLAIVPSSTRPAGRPLSTAESATGRYQFTLVLRRGADTLTILDTRTGRSRLVALTGVGYTLVPDVDDRQVWAVSLAAGRVTLIETATGSFVSSSRFDVGVRPSAYTVAALAPDGQHLAASDGDHIFVLTPGILPPRRIGVHTSIAVGWSPDERTLWVLGERSRFSPLRPRAIR
ncbi:MAG TPA: hypothetical protein VHV52_08975 [Gaiellaceae bacterium]|nr:hypothetical protein [Gaiellaceae bacterium]